jgi:hypothetical protein
LQVHRELAERERNQLDQVARDVADDEWVPLMGDVPPLKTEFFEEGKEHIVLPSDDYTRSFYRMDSVEYGGEINYYNADGEIHRNFGPAMTYKDVPGYAVWVYQNHMHRQGGPAYVNPMNGETIYAVRAMREEDGDIISIRHRLDGPAFIKKDQEGNVVTEKYYIGNKEISKKDYPRAVAEWIYLYNQ